MSRKIPREQYEKSRVFKFKQWLDGTKDMYVDNVEMVPQEEFKETRAQLQNRLRERKTLLQQIHDIKNNKEIKWFNRLYKVFWRKI